MAGLRLVTTAIGGLALAGALVWALWPEPQAVDLATVSRGPMQVTISGEGMTRVREPYSVAAPITGSAMRSPVQVGDAVVRGETVIAVLRPAEPALMDARSRLQAEAAVTEAEAALDLAETNLERAESALDYAAGQLTRGRALAERGTMAQRMLEELEQAHRSAVQARLAAEQQRELHRASLQRAQAQLLGPAADLVLNGNGDECCLRIHAPVTGTVLDVTDPSARLVQAGSPLLSIGDISDLEIELDLLSSDAVRVPPGARASIERWGGEGVLEARVNRVEPAAFTRISALGIEEQRVRLRLDLLSPPEARAGLGDRFRVFVRLVIWEGEDILQLPQSALFRHENGWAVFRADQGQARLVPVGIGRQAEGRAEVLDGLAPGDAVILYPPSNLEDGARIAPRAG